MKKSLLEKLPYEEVEDFGLYRLGIFGKSSFNLVEMPEGKIYPPHRHNNSESTFYMILGQGEIITDDRKERYKPGDTFYVAKGVMHGFRPETPTLFLSINTPPITDLVTGMHDIEF